MDSDSEAVAFRVTARHVASTGAMVPVSRSAGQPVRGGWKGSFVRCMSGWPKRRYGRLVPILDTTLDHENARPPTHRIGQDPIGTVNQRERMAAQRHCPAWAEPWIRPGGAGIGRQARAAASVSRTIRGHLVVDDGTMGP